MKEQIQNSSEIASDAVKPSLGDHFNALKSKVEGRFGGRLKETFDETAKQLPDLPDLSAEPAPTPEAMADAGVNRAKEALGQAGKLLSTAKETAVDRATVAHQAASKAKDKATEKVAKAEMGRKTKKAGKLAKKAAKKTSERAVGYFTDEEKGRRRTATAVALGVTTVAAIYAYKRYNQQGNQEQAPPQPAEPPQEPIVPTQPTPEDLSRQQQLEDEKEQARLAAQEQARLAAQERARQVAQEQAKLARERNKYNADLMDLTDQQLKTEYDLGPKKIALVRAISKARGRGQVDKDGDPYLAPTSLNDLDDFLGADYHDLDSKELNEIFYQLRNEYLDRGIDYTYSPPKVPKSRGPIRDWVRDTAVWTANTTDDVINGALERALWIPEVDTKPAKDLRSSRTRSLTVAGAKAVASTTRKTANEAWVEDKLFNSADSAWSRGLVKRLDRVPGNKSEWLEFSGPARQKAKYLGQKAVNKLAELRKVGDAPEPPAAEPTEPSRPKPASDDGETVIPWHERGRRPDSARSHENPYKDVVTRAMTSIEGGALGAAPTDNKIDVFLQPYKERFSIDNDPSPEQVAAYRSIVDAAEDYAAARRRS